MDFGRVRKIFFKMAIAKIITREKIFKSQNFAIFRPLEDTKKFDLNKARADLLNIYVSQIQ